MDDFDKLYWSLDQLRMLIPGQWKERNGKVNCRCPICGDSQKSNRKARLWLYKDTSSFYCFNCGANGSLFKLISLVSGKKISSVKRDWLLHCKNQNRSIGEALSNTELASDDFRVLQNEPKQKNNSFILPPEWSDINDDCKALLNSRHIFDAPYLPKNYKFYFDNQYNRLVIPWKTNNEITYYQSRALYKKQEPKYIFPPNTEKPVFFPQSLDPELPYIFVFEGFLDAIYCKNSVVAGGLRLSHSQSEYLENMSTDYQIVLFTDNPYKDESSFKFVEKTALTTPKKLFFQWTKDIEAKDLNEYLCRTKQFDLCTSDEYLKSHIITASKYYLMLKM